MVVTITASSGGAASLRMVSGSLNCACVVKGEALMGWRIGKALTSSAGTEASSFAAAPMAVFASPPICADTITKWMLCG